MQNIPIYIKKSEESSAGLSYNCISWFGKCIANVYFKFNTLVGDILTIFGDKISLSRLTESSTKVIMLKEF